MALPEPMCLHASAHRLGLSEERLGHRNPGVREREAAGGEHMERDLSCRNNSNSICERDGIRSTNTERG